METLRSLVASLGASGAVRNVEQALRTWEAEDRAVAELGAALARLDGLAVVGAAA